MSGRRLLALAVTFTVAGLAGLAAGVLGAGQVALAIDHHDQASGQ